MYLACILLKKHLADIRLLFECRPLFEPGFYIRTNTVVARRL